MTVRVGLITTLRTNIGDDLIRVGIRRLLRDLVRDEIEFLPVNKHRPLEAWPDLHPVQLTRLTRRVPRLGPRVTPALSRAAFALGHSRFDRMDLIVQCGAPVLYPGCALSAWVGPIWDRIVGRLVGRVPAVNLAAGSCYPWETPPDRVPDGNDAAFLGRMLEWCARTTVRDRLAAALCSGLGHEVPDVPCSAMLALPGEVDLDGDLVLVNVMEGGGHFDWEQRIDPDRWRATAGELVARLARRHRVVFLCHDAKEEALARRLDGTLPRVRPRTVREYAEVVRGATLAIANRMHASVALAGRGVPSIAVGTDTRLLMVERLGLPVVYVKEADADGLEARLEDLHARRREERDRLLALREETRTVYRGVMEGVLP